MIYDLNDGIETVETEVESVRDKLSMIDESLTNVEVAIKDLQSLKDKVYNKVEEANSLIGDISFDDGEDAVTDAISDVMKILEDILSDIS